ncbi:hypothetical protein FJZ17_03740 [Candidatus Pacearchaeota archaeon]|nr:hypothetical protein [Candidatus Pacearchaeota archaeon]
MGRKTHTNRDIQTILGSSPVNPEEESDLPEDLLIPGQDGNACANWELRGKGFSLVPDDEINRYFR